MKTLTTAILLLTGAVAFAQESPSDDNTAKPKGYDGLTFKVFEQSKPKPMGTIPAGWKLAVIEGQKTEQPPIKLPNGKMLTPKSAAYVVVPESGKYILDPGFDVTKGNAQTNTLGAVLTRYSEETKGLETKLDTLIEALQAALNDANAPEVKKAAKAKN